MDNEENRCPISSIKIESALSFSDPSYSEAKGTFSDGKKLYFSRTADINTD